MQTETTLDPSLQLSPQEKYEAGGVFSLLVSILNSNWVCFTLSRTCNGKHREAALLFFPYSEITSCLAIVLTLWFQYFE